MSNCLVVEGVESWVHTPERTELSTEKRVRAAAGNGSA